MSGRQHKHGRERGFAIPLLMVLLGLGSAWLVVSAVSDTSSRLAAERARDTAALKQAKEALVAWIATKALEAGENNPGRLPCPEAPAYVGTAACEGIAAPGVCETISAPTCSMVGRLPWRTLGLDKLTDADGQPLWYVVSPGWSLSTSSSLLTINSGSTGQLTVDGAANAAVALIIAPGRVMDVLSADGCAPRAQSRSAAGAPDLRDYLECDNATSPADASFVSAGPATSFNDQVLQITVADVMPILEAAIAKRIERDIAPAMQKVYTTTPGIGSWYGWSSNTPHYPFAVPFGDPSSSNYIGSASPATYQGLLPMATTAANPGFVAWNTAASSAWHSWSYSGTVNWYDCWTWFSSTELWCEVNYSGRPVFGFWAQAYNVGTSLRAFNPAAAVAAGASGLNWYEGYLDYDGSGWVYAEVVLPDRGVVDGTHWFNLPISFLADHSLLDPNHPATGWFVRNQWHRFSFYAVSEGFAPGWNSQCDTAGNPPCLTVSTPSASLSGRRAILALAGRGLNGQTRPSSALADYLDSAANRDGNTTFEQKPVNAIFNDRIVTVDANP
jgi:hypothetical protein